MPFVAYCNFETTAPTDCSHDPEITKMLAILYAIIFAFHPDLNLDRIIVEPSFGHNLSRLVNIGYFNCDMLQNAYLITMNQFHYCTIKVISEMFTTEIKSAANFLIKWFDKIYKSKNFENKPPSENNSRKKQPNKLAK